MAVPSGHDCVALPSAGWSGTADATLPELFERQVHACSERVAVAWEGGAVSYSQLNQRANELARRLVSEGVGPEQIVAVDGSRSCAMVTAILAVLKAGGAYLPLDLAQPRDRVLHIVGRTNPRILVATRNGLSLRPKLRCVVLQPDGRVDRAVDEVAENLSQVERRAPLLPEHPAYIVFTSGSSGAPKAVVGLHRGMVNRLSWMHAIRRYSAEAPVLAKTAITFIDGTTELLGALIGGGTVVLGPGQAGIDDLAHVVQRFSIGRITVVPSLLRTLVAEWPPAVVRTVSLWISSGEPLPDELGRALRDLSPSAELLNLYGMSEASGDSVWGADSEEPRLFSAPVWNTDVHLLDEQLEPAAAGMRAEVYLGGVGLARGYLNEPGGTAERFVPNPYGAPGSRLYRSGDLARWASDRRLDLLGRADRQVKIAGVRIEPAEIEGALRSLTGVREAVVAIQGKEGSRALVAYVVPCLGSDSDPKTVRAQLRDVLPAPLLPSAIVCLTEIPRLHSGKVDWAALPEPSADRVLGREPCTPEEGLLCDVFGEFFGRDMISPDSDFFELGGHSLQAMQLVSRVRARFGIELPVATVFAASRISELAAQLASIRSRQ